MKSYLMDIPSNDYINSKTFPQLGGLPNEVGSGTSPGGIGGPWISNIPLPYYFFSSKRTKKSKKTSKRKTHKKTSKRKTHKKRISKKTN